LLALSYLDFSSNHDKLQNSKLRTLSPDGHAGCRGLREISQFKHPEIHYKRASIDISINFHFGMISKEMSMGQKPTSAFRQEVVRVALTSGLSRMQVASDFRIGFSTLSRWMALSD
jgi:hypothetical protein